MQQSRQTPPLHRRSSPQPQEPPLGQVQVQIQVETPTPTATEPAHVSNASKPLTATLPPTMEEMPPKWEPMRTSSPNSRSRYLSNLHHSLRATREGDCAADAFWSTMQAEARDAAQGEPLLASFLFCTVLNHSTLHSALAFHLANKLASPAMPSTMLMRLFQTAMDDDADFCNRVRRDLLAVMERDPACLRFIDALLYFKGFHALQAHRIAHILWRQKRAALAYHLQSQVSKELQVDIHPAAIIGAGVFIDHATGIVIGETATIGDDCSLLHHVTLGGSGKKHGDRHPKLGKGVLVGAGATLLGNVHIGDGVQIGACSLVLEDIPDHATIVGVPAKVLYVQGVSVPAPARDMKHERCLPGCKDLSHGHDVSDSSSTPGSPASSEDDPKRAKQ